MPYILDGLCVYKKNEDGSKGEQIGCSETEAEAQKYFEALRANAPDAKSEPEPTEPEPEQPTMAIKSLGDDRFGGYLAIWGHPGQKDLTNEYFTPRTDGMTELFEQLEKLPVLFHHGADKTLKATLVGMMDTMEPDDIGLWVEGILNKRNKYVEGVKKLLGANALGWSSGALPGTVQKAKNGEIQRWVIGEGTMTHAPAEPRMTNARHLVNAKALSVACKAMNLQLPDNLLVQDDGSRAEKESGRSVHAPAVNSIAQPKQERTRNVDKIEVIETDDVIEEGQQQAQAIADAAKGVAESMADMKKQFQQTTTDMIIQQLAALKAQIDNTQENVKAIEKRPTKALPNPQPNGDGRHIEVIRATKYSHLKPEEMSFLYEVLNGSLRGGWNPGDGFFRELADKAVKAVQKEQLPPDALKGLVDAMGGSIKANELDNIGQSSFGLEWAPDSWRSLLWMRVRQDNTVAPLFEMIEMPTQPYELPIETTDPTVFFVPETTDVTQLVYGAANPITLSKVGSGKVQFSSKKLGLRVAWSSELNEDSIIPVIGQYQRQCIRTMRNAIDNLLVNGDTAAGASANVNLIDGTPTAGTKYLAFDGLRKYCLVTNTGQGKDGAGAVTVPLMRATRFLLTGAYALQPRECAWIVDDSAYPTLLNMPEFITVDKAGAAATNLNGLIGQIDGVPVVATAELGLTQASGKISGTPANNVKGQAIIVFRPNWIIGYRRQVNAEVERLAWADAYHLTLTARLHLVSFDAKSAAELYDLTV